MKLYSARVRIDGDRDHEVDKHALTAAEMKLLEMLHVSKQGHPTLTNIKHTGDVNRSDAKERSRLAMLYTKGELVEDRGEKIITGLFGVAGVPLPTEYVAPVNTVVENYEVEDEEDEVITPVAPPVRSTPKTSKKTVEDVVG